MVSLRFDFEAIVASLLKKAAPDRPRQPMPAIDECLNHPIVNSMVIEACNAGLVFGSSPLWNQRRLQNDGSIFYAWGGLPRNFKASPDLDVGKPEKRAKWDDEQVVFCLLGNLIGANIVLLTENIRLDERGIRRILKSVVAPKLDQTVSLTGIFKRGRTTYADYCKGTIEFLSERRFSGGYKEILL